MPRLHQTLGLFGVALALVLSCAYGLPARPARRIVSYQEPTPVQPKFDQLNSFAQLLPYPVEPAPVREEQYEPPPPDSRQTAQLRQQYGNPSSNFMLNPSGYAQESANFFLGGGNAGSFNLGASGSNFGAAPSSSFNLGASGSNFGAAPSSSFNLGASGSNFGSASSSSFNFGTSGSNFGAAPSSSFNLGGSGSNFGAPPSGVVQVANQPIPNVPPRVVPPPPTENLPVQNVQPLSLDPATGQPNRIVNPEFRALISPHALPVNVPVQNTQMFGKGFGGAPILDVTGTAERIAQPQTTANFGGQSLNFGTSTFGQSQNTQSISSFGQSPINTFSSNDLQFLGDNASSQGQTFGARADQQGQTFGVGADQQGQTFGVGADQQGQTFGAGADQQGGSHHSFSVSLPGSASFSSTVYH